MERQRAKALDDRAFTLLFVIKWSGYRLTQRE